MFDRVPSAQPVSMYRRTVAISALAVLALLQLAPVGAAAAALGGYDGVHLCGCAGIACSCPHPGEARPSCHLGAQSTEDVLAFDTCDPPRPDGAPAPPGVLAAPVLLRGPVTAGFVVLPAHLRARPVARGPEPPPPRSSAA